MLIQRKALLTIVNAVAMTSLLFIACADPSSHARTKGESEVGTKVKRQYGESTLEDLRSSFKDICEVGSLTPAQTESLTRLHEDWIEQFENWYSENGPKIIAIRREAFEAAKERSLRKLKAMERKGADATIAKLINHERSMLKSYWSEMEAAIPDSELTKWQAFVMTRNLLEFAGPLSLTAEQCDQIRERSVPIAQRFQTEENWRGYGTMELEKWFERSIIEPEQKADFDALKKKKRIRMLIWSQSNS